MASRLVERDRDLSLSRSWTTRPPRPGEPEGAYTFVDRDSFERRAAEGGFLEWAEVLGHLYGTPTPEPSSQKDLVLEIDVQGARQVRRLNAGAVVVLVVPPSREEQAHRLRARGDGEGQVARRLALGALEEAEGRQLADHVVVNDDVERAVAELAGIIGSHRSGATKGGVPRARRPNGAAR